MEKNRFVHHKSHMDFTGVMVDPKEEDDPLLVKYTLVKAENGVSCVRACAPAYCCALLIAVFNPLFFRNYFCCDCAHCSARSRWCVTRGQKGGPMGCNI